jgi:hypothetical protein
MSEKRQTLIQYIENSDEFLVLSDLKRLGLIDKNELVDATYWDIDDQIEFAKIKFGIYQALN